MLIPALALCVYGAGVWLRGAMRFWKESGTGEARSLVALVRATIAAIGLRNLSGGGPGCYYPEEQPNQLRRIYHSLTVWGFTSTLVSTTLAYIYQDFLHWLPPYPVLSAPVLFGSIGGLGIIVGCAGLVWLKWRSDQAPADEKTISMDYVFLIMLALTALTGELTLMLRDTRAMGMLLVLHLGTVAGLFLTAPYGKFVHLVYRSLALVRHENEQQVERDRRLVASSKESR
jgi:citrate/tricarballylate utilization protein